MTRWFCLCALLAACASAETPPTGQTPDANEGVPDAGDPGIDADDCVPTTEECDGDDDDCDDVPDNGCACTDGDTQPCYTGDTALIGHGVCAQGTQTCVDGAWSATCAGEVLPSAETCDTLDNDCDDAPDDGNPGGGACSTGMSGICAAGTRTCAGGVLSGCVANMSPTTEVCNGLDDDCNAGTPDGSAEAWFGDPCDGGDIDACNEGTFACTSMAQSCSDATGDSNVILDGSFEASIGTSVPWSQGSTLFGTPLCTFADCGDGGTPPGPNTGNVWNWLGGTAAAETAFATQTLAIPVGTTATLTWMQKIPACGVGGAAETFVVSVDGTPVYSTNNSDPTCGVNTYVLRSANVSAFANGANHAVDFRGTFNTGQPTATNFFIDDVRLVSCP